MTNQELQEKMAIAQLAILESSHGEQLRAKAMEFALQTVSPSLDRTDDVMKAAYRIANWLATGDEVPQHNPAHE